MTLDAPDDDNKDASARWMTLLEAIECIRTTTASKSVVAAQVHLKRGISRGVIPVKWADSSGSARIDHVSDFARLQLALAAPGLAPHRRPFSLRPLLVLRAALKEWASASEETTNRPEDENKWMSLVEAVEHIRMSQDCDSIEALRQLKGEIADGILSITWADEPNILPDRRALSQSSFLLIGMGFAPDESQETFRPVLLDRFSVNRLWSLPSSGYAEAAKNEPFTPAIKPIRELSKSRIREALRTIYDKAGKFGPNVNDAFDAVREIVRNPPRGIVMEILREDEFSRRRRRPGNQPKPKR
jgi:hypothetical protein